MNTNKGQPLYLQVYEALKSAIDNGTYAPGEQIPPEMDLALSHGVSRVTAGRAIEKLCRDGYLVRQQGRGTFVSTPLSNRRIEQDRMALSFSDACDRNGMQPGARLIGRDLAVAEDGDAAFLNLEPGAPLLHVRRVRTADGVPIFEENVYVEYDRYRSLMDEPLEDMPMFDVLERVGGRRPTVRTRRTVEAVNATAEQASRLGVRSGDALLHVHLFLSDDEGVPVCTARQLYVGRRYRMVL